MSSWFIFWNIFLIGGLIKVWSRGFTIFQSRITIWLLSNYKVLNTCEDKKRRQIVPVLKEYLEKFDIIPSMLVLSVLAWSEKEAY